MATEIDIYLLPGLDGTGKLFSPLLEALPKYFTVHVISYPVDEVLSYAELASLVREKLPRDRPFILLAESFSGPIAIEIASSHPSHLAAVVLSGTFVSYSVNPLLKFTSSLLGAYLFKLNPPHFIIRHFLLGPNRSKDLLETVISAIKEVSPKVLAGRLNSVFKVDARKALVVCRVPMLYMSASEDKLVGKGSIEEIESLRPEVKTVAIKAPHLLLQTEPVKAVEVISEFLQDSLLEE